MPASRSWNQMNKRARLKFFVRSGRAVRKPRLFFDYANTTRIENGCESAEAKPEDGETAESGCESPQTARA
jgi:hypothetical protein